MSTPPDRTASDRTEQARSRAVARTDEDGPSTQQVVEWSVCGLVAAASRFVPVPVVDDVIRDRATRLAVARTLRAHGRTYDVDLVEAVYDPQERGGALRSYVSGLPKRILLFPVRKYVAIARTLRRGPTDVLDVVLLARAVDRALSAGRLAGPDPEQLHADAVAVRAAYDAARKGADLRLATSALSDGLSGAKDAGRAALALARRLVDRDGPEVDDRSVADAAAQEGPVRDGALRVAETLRRPEVAAQLARFDAAVDAALAAPPARRR